MKYWLIKSDPDTYSWHNMIKDKRTHWDGVRNFQARNNINAMKKGDKCLFYHSQNERSVVGIVEVVKEAYPDPSDREGKFTMMDVKVLRSLDSPVALSDIKQRKILQDMALVKQSRLSVMLVTKTQYDAILKMGERE